MSLHILYKTKPCYIYLSVCLSIVIIKIFLKLNDKSQNMKMLSS